MDDTTEKKAISDEAMADTGIDGSHGHFFEKKNSKLKYAHHLYTMASIFLGLGGKKKCNLKIKRK